MLLKRLFYYRLPRTYIAQSLTHPRDMCRLMVVRDGEIAHRRFLDLPEILPEDAVLILNRTKVIPALLEAWKDTGGKIVLLFVDLGDGGVPKAFIKGKVREGVVGRTQKGTSVRALRHLREGLFEVEVKRDCSVRGKDLLALLKEEGKTPLPPYIKRRDLPDEEYQTVYAVEEGSVAAPTAGLHFTERLLNALRQRGVEVRFVSLDVGPGTFMPVRSESVENHRMEGERYRITGEDFSAINRALKGGRPLVAVGTTTVRALESASEGGKLVRRVGVAEVFIYPSYRFSLPYHAFITNFHLPESTPLLMLSAFIGWERVYRAYMEAIARGYRFYSLGDAMAVFLPQEGGE